MNNVSKYSLISKPLAYTTPTTTTTNTTTNTNTNTTTHIYISVLDIFMLDSRAWTFSGYVNSI